MCRLLLKTRQKTTACTYKPDVRLAFPIREDRRLRFLIFFDIFLQDINVKSCVTANIYRLHSIIKKSTVFWVYVTRHLGCTNALDTGIWLTMSSLGTRTGRTWERQGPCAVRLLDWPSTHPGEVQTSHPANKKTPRTKYCKGALCLQAEEQPSCWRLLQWPWRTAACHTPGWSGQHRRAVGSLQRCSLLYCMWRPGTNNPQQSRLLRWEWGRGIGTAVRKTPTVPNTPEWTPVTSKDRCLCKR